MSRFLSSRHAALTPYTPGEQPRDMQYVKLNTNESPYPPASAVVEAVASEASKANLYCDPECTVLREKAAGLYGVSPANILPVNGSDEILYFAFMAFCDENHPVAFPDISYGFYPVYAEVNHIPAVVVPLHSDFTIDPADYNHTGASMIVIANPNAPTGIALSAAQVEGILKDNPNSVVLIDEAYVDFGAESVVSLIHKYDNLLVTQTFSKSRSLAGARLGFGIACESLIADLNTIKYSTNPYNVNRMTQRAGAAAVDTNDYYMANCRTIAETRAYTAQQLTESGFRVLPSCANFLFAESPDIDGGELYRLLKQRGVLIRHFDKERIANFNRITIGTRDQMDVLLREIRRILDERKA